MPTFKEHLTRAKGRAGEAWAGARRRWAAHPLTSKIRRPSRKGALVTLGSVAGVCAGLLVVIGLMDWNYLRGPIENAASNRLGRTVKIDGDIDVELLRWSPEADVRGIRISNPAWAGGGDMTRIDRLQVRVKLLPLLKGDVVMPLLKIDQPAVALVRREDGTNNWTFRKRSNKPLKLPPIRRFEINSGSLSIDDDKRRLVFKGTINSSEDQDGQRVQAFKLMGDGTLNGAKFDLDLTGGPLLNVDPDRPYPFDARVSAGATRVLAKGTIAEPFNLGVFDTSLDIRGDDLAELYYLTGLALPNTPPYQVNGQFARRGWVYTYSGVNGRFGDSDVHGHVAVETGDEIPFMSGDIYSRRLDFDDLAAVLGGGAKAGGGETASPAQAAKARQMAASGRLFPDTPLRVERLRAMNAQVRYRADQIVDARFPIRKGSANIRLNNAVLSLDPVSFTLDRGQLAGLVAINAQKDTPVVNLDMRMTGARVEEFVPAKFKPVVSGGLVGRAKLTGVGKSVQAAASSANGQVTVVVPSGQMRKGVAELMGVNVLRALFTDKSEVTQVRCAVADFKVRDGIMNAETIVFDTGPVIVAGGGVINLKNERIDIRVKGHPKELRLLRLSMPLELQGSLRQPRFGVETGTAVGQGALAAVLGSVLSPLAAILPFVDAGMADDANCAALIGGAGTPTPKGQQAAKTGREKRS